MCLLSPNGLNFLIIYVKMSGCAVGTRIVNQSQTEIMHLKATIVALREQLEALSFDKDKAVQKAVLLSSDEIQQLKDMTSSLRSELENLRFEKDAAVQRAVQSSADEIQQLKMTIASLRSEMESKKIE